MQNAEKSETSTSGSALREIYYCTCVKHVLSGFVCG